MTKVRDLVAISLFSGIGGLDIAAERCGIQSAVFSEIEPFPCSILRKRWKNTQNVGDIRAFSSRPLAELGGSPFYFWKTPQDIAANVVFGGFPCQDLSVAGSRRGLIDEHGTVTRSGLWFEMLRVIREAQPEYIIGENVRGSVNLALDQIKEGLEGEGYSVYPFVVPASLFGAPHKRERLFVLGVKKDLAERFSRTFGGRFTGTTSGSGTSMEIIGSGGFWRTPDAGCGRGPSSRSRLRMKIDTGAPISLNDQVAHQDMFCGIGGDGSFELFPTPVKEDWRRRGPASRQKGLPEIIYEMTMYPTPTVNGNYNRAGVSATSGDGLETVLKKDGACGSLSPDWVSVLMGYPVWWTDSSSDKTLADWDWTGFPAPRNARLSEEAAQSLKISLFDPETGQYFWEPPRTCRGIKNRTARIKALGNSVVPAQARFVFLAASIIHHILENAEVDSGASDSPGGEDRIKELVQECGAWCSPVPGDSWEWRDKRTKSGKTVFSHAGKKGKPKEKAAAGRKKTREGS